VSDLDDRRDEARTLRDKLMGEASRTQASSTPGLAMFSAYGLDHVWGGAWLDGTLDLRSKCTATITALIALRNFDVLALHARGALNVGVLTIEELRALALHLSPYVSFPVARAAVAVIDALVPTPDPAGPTNGT
jgi:alkylhydroperoxidase/carboxymuconolactone decarboxylase family protein YurZ